MPSPTTSTPRRTSKRTSTKRSPLQERTASQKNGVAGRLQRDSKPEMRDSEIFTTTPFPTKPQHVLLPSTIRKQRSRQNVENELPSFFFNHSHPELPGAGTSQESRYEERRVRRAPNLQLKRSVSALRDMYEAQAESSRPSTAAFSPALRPTSSRMRSISSSEGLSGRSAWEMLGLPKVSADDLSILPPLSELPQTLDSEHSFASRVRHQVGTSSPNFRTFSSSNPDLPAIQDLAASSDPLEASSSSGMQATAASSPNVVQLFHSSSVLATDPTPPSLEEEAEAESSPNVLKLGTTSPQRSTSPTPSHASTGSRKRKRSEMEGRSTYASKTPLFFTGQDHHMRSSPPIQNPLSSSQGSLQSESRFLPSSPPEAGSAGSQTFPASSPVFRVLGRSSSVDRGSLVSAHASLQNALSSSPAPPIQRPIVKAPNINQFETLAMQKRAASGPSRLDDAAPQRLSPVPSVSNIEAQQVSSPTDSDDFLPPQTSMLSGFAEELDENLDDESMAPVQAYMMHHDLNSSQVRIMSDIDQHEAADELSALPRTHSSFAAALSHAKSSSFLGSSSSSNSPSRLDSWRTSMEERMQSMRSFVHGRTDSMRSSYRPGSSGSYMSASVVPTWARGYYSGFYRDSFHYLYRSSSNLGYAVTQVQPPSRHASPRTSSPSSPLETVSPDSNSTSRRSLSRSVRSSMKNIIPSIALPSARPRLNVRQSHTTAGIGPLVSNPVRPVSEMISRPASAYHSRNTVRRVSMPLSAADPRFHWNGIVEEPESAEEARQLNDHAYTGVPRYGESTSLQAPPQPPNERFEPPLRFMRLPTPHLHHDRQLHTGSSASHGYGAPYNTRPKWQPSGGYTDELGRPSWFRVDLRDLQVVCFMAGFLFPLTWFFASVMPLPVRPCSYPDLEKMEATHQGQPHPDWDNVDVLARLRLEKHLRGLEEVRWQNARWWRRMNRWMSFVGLVILVVVIVLAVIGTRSHWT